MTSTSINEVIGLDLGHGETAVARTLLKSHEPPVMLEILGEPSVITALAHDKDGRVEIGERAIIMPNARDLEIYFKGSDDPVMQDILREFVIILYQHLVETGQIERGERSSFFIGHPSGWKGKKREAYSQLLASCGIPHLTVIPESRAALVRARESGVVKAEELNEYVLVIDIGSSTTDFTLVKGLSKDPIDDFGYDLGGSQIDIAIFERSLANSTRRRDFEEIFDKHPVYRTLAILECRRMKEKYFANPNTYQNAPLRGTVDISDDYPPFRIVIDQPIMEEIISQPLSILGEKSWRGYFHEVVNEVKANLAHQGYKPSVILATGGASRMGIIQEVCQEVFPEPVTVYRRDSEPQWSIAKGLAHAGRIRFHTEAFMQDITNMCDQELPAIIKEHIPALIQALTSPLTDGILEHVIRRGLLDWRTGKVDTLAELKEEGGYMQTLAEQWLKSKQTKSLIARVSSTWLKPVQQELNEKSLEIAHRYWISGEVLRINADVDMEKPEGLDAFEGTTDMFDTVSVIIASIIASAVAAAFLAFAHPVGAVIGGLIALIIGIMAAAGVSVELEKQSFPLWTRSMMLPDWQIDRVLKKKQNREKVEKGIQEMLEKGLNSPDFVQKIGN